MTLRLRVSSTGLYTYPDVMAFCGEPQYLDSEVDTLLNPTMIAEVLSATTESYDRGRKFDHYRRLASLKEYVLVAQDEVEVGAFYSSGRRLGSLRVYEPRRHGSPHIDRLRGLAARDLRQSRVRGGWGQRANFALTDSTCLLMTTPSRIA